MTHKILQDNSFDRKKLRQVFNHLDHAVDELRNAIFSRSVSDEKKEIFKNKEVDDLVRRHFFALKREHEKILDLKFDLQLKIISSPRALAMAKNLFLHGDLKTLREALRKFFLQEKYFIDKHKVLLDF